LIDALLEINKINIFKYLDFIPKYFQFSKT